MKKIINSTLAILTLTSTLPTHATSTEAAYLEDFPVILSASRLKQSSLETPASVTVIDRKLIIASGARQIPELLRFVPGMQLGHATDNIPIVTYNGLGDRYSRRVQVLIDGRSVYTPSFGGVSWENLPITVDDIEKIEVIRGPNSALYGSNSFSAVISITTRFSAGTVRSGIFTTIEDSANNRVKLNYNNTGQRHDSSFSAFYDTDNGDKNAQEKSEADDDRRRAFNFAIDFQLSELDNLQLSAGVLDGIGKKGANVTLDAANPIRDQSRDYNYFQLKHDHQLNNGDHFYWQVFQTQEEVAEMPFSYQIPIPASSIGAPAALQDQLFIAADENTAYKSSRLEAELVYTGEIGRHFRYVTGGSIRQDQVTASRLLRSKQDINVSRFFLNTEIRATDSLLIGLGAMHEDHEYTDEQVSPKLSLVQKLGEQQALRFIASKATRAPVAMEEATRFATNTWTFSPLIQTQFNPPQPFIPLGQVASGDLKNEEQTSYELGYKFLFNDQTSFIDLRLFYNQLENIIHEYKRSNGVDLYPTDSQGFVQQLVTIDSGLGEIPGFFNFIDMDIKGVELELNQKITDYFTLRSGLSYVDMENKNSSQEIQQFINSGILAKEVDNRLRDSADSAPRKSGLLSATFTPSDAVSINLSYHYIDNSSWLGDGATNLGIQRIVDFYTQIMQPLDRKRALKVGMGVRNLIHDDYVDFNSRNPSETVSYVKLGIDF